MNRINELIKKMCPNGVEYKTLDKVCSVTTGNQLNKDKLLDEAEYPVINGGINPSGYWHEYNTDKNTITISQGGASAGYVNYMETPFWAGAHCYVVKLEEKKVNYRYLYHYIKSIEKKLQKCQQGAGIPSVSRKTIYENCIPVPPLEVQNEIVRILDDLTLLSKELSEELLAELKARKKQYEYYREKLLDKGKNVEWVPLLSISDTYTGLTYKPSDVASQGTLVLRSSNIKENRLVFEDNVYVKIDNIPERTIVKKDDILICVRNGSKALIGKAAMIPKHEEKMAFGAFMTILRPSNKVIPKYLFYVWQSPRIQDMIHNDSGMPINQITKKMLEDIKVPLTSLQEQEEIVKILDIIDKLCMEITKIIPIEIENRKKQYEYYRDKLLTFKELKVNE